MFPYRKQLPHGIPSWIQDCPKFFVTICCRPRSINQLCNDQAFSLIRESLQFRQNRGDLWIAIVLLMPDHLHTIVSFSAHVDMRKCISQWKRYISINSTVMWQRDFHDHRLRNADSFTEKLNYIQMNPVRAGLIESKEKWPFYWQNDA